MKKAAVIMSTFLMVVASNALADGYLEYCDASTKELYFDIQLYRATKKVSTDHVVINKTLESEISELKNIDGTVEDKVNLIETSFTKCYIDLNKQEKEQIQIEVETLKKMLNPLEV